MSAVVDESLADDYADLIAEAEATLPDHRWIGVPDERPVLLIDCPDVRGKVAELLPAYSVCSWRGDARQIDWQEFVGTALGLGEEVRIDCISSNGPAYQAAVSHITGEFLNSGIPCRVRVIDSRDMPDGWTLAAGLADAWDGTRLLQWARRDSGAHMREVKAPADPKKAKRKRIETADSKESDHVRWRNMGLDLGSSGRPAPNEDTVERVLSHEKISIWYDEFLQRAMTTWRSDEARPLADSDIALLLIWFQRTLRLEKMSLAKVRAGVEAYLYVNRRNVAQEWLRGLSWDGTRRLADVAPIGFGTERNPYYEAVGKNFIIGIAHRLLEPGCQLDNLPVFEGPQGIKKSTALRILGGEWFTEIHENVTSKDFLQCLPGHMLLEVSELHSFRRSDIEKVKGIISNRVDTYRASYGRLSGSYPRQCAFAGTTNRDDWNMDDTGARRFWRVKCGTIDTEWIAKWREQLFAEAVIAVDMCEPHWQVPTEYHKQLTDEAREGEPWREPILNYARSRPYVIPEALLGDCLSIPTERQDKSHTNRVRAILRTAGWKRGTRREGREVFSVWYPPADDAPRQVIVPDGAGSDPF